MAQKRGWTKETFAYATRTLGARLENTDPSGVRHMTVEMTLANGAEVRYVKLFEYDVTARRTKGPGLPLALDKKFQTHFVASIGSAYALWVEIEGHPGGTAKTAVYYPPLPPADDPNGPLPDKGTLATNWPAKPQPPFLVPVPSSGAIK